MKKACLLIAALLSLTIPVRAEQSLLEILGTNRIDSAGAPVQNEPLPKKLTAVYFSAHWCPPCRAFTPKLVDVYNQATKQGLDFAVVFVSFDNSAEDMMDYMKQVEMPWTALPYDSPASEQAKKFKSKTLKSNGIPFLVVLNTEGAVVTTDGRDDVENLGVQAIQKWSSAKPEPIDTVTTDDNSVPEKETEPEGLPAPEKKRLDMTELNLNLFNLDGKVVETKINSILSFEQVASDYYRAYCFYTTANTIGSGESVLIPEEGKEFFSKAAEQMGLSFGSRSRSETVYLLVCSKKPFSVKNWPFKLKAVGTRYKKSTGEYSW